MSEMAARKCSGKVRHESERRAVAAAKATQVKTGCKMRAYACEFCKHWHVGNLLPANGRIARLEASRAEEVAQRPPR